MPGDLIGTSEEYSPKYGTFEDKGNIYAATTGFVKVDKKHRYISVSPVVNSPPFIKCKDVVVGQVSDVKESVAFVKIACIKGKPDREIINNSDAVIHVSNVKDDYVKSLKYEFSQFDIIKGEIIDSKNMRISTVKKEFGVIKAFCSKCNTSMKRNNNKLKCPVCGKIETRKISCDYGTGMI